MKIKFPFDNLLMYLDCCDNGIRIRGLLSVFLQLLLFLSTVVSGEKKKKDETRTLRWDD